jgi:GNAT superfamily N-acetyltransferase
VVAIGRRRPRRSSCLGRRSALQWREEGQLLGQCLRATHSDKLSVLAWRKSYDLHHCLTGGEILDLYVLPEYRGRGVAPVLVCAVAAEMLRRGGAYVKGQAVEHRVVQRLYARFAMCFPGADCIVGGRAFRRLAELAGRSARVVARSLPEKSWNYEP